MKLGKRQQDATLLDVLIDGFEKNEVLDGFHRRMLPLPDEESARERFSTLATEAERWKGPPVRSDRESPHRFAVWTDLELLQAGRALLVRVRAPRFDGWWHEPKTWAGDPFRELDEWLAENEQAEGR